LPDKNRPVDLKNAKMAGYRTMSCWNLAIWRSEQGPFFGWLGFVRRFWVPDSGPGLDPGYAPNVFPDLYASGFHSFFNFLSGYNHNLKVGWKREGFEWFATLKMSQNDNILSQNDIVFVEGYRILH
jgi:hypothetical protein